MVIWNGTKKWALEVENITDIPPDEKRAVIKTSVSLFISDPLWLMMGLKKGSREFYLSLPVTSIAVLEKEEYIRLKNLIDLLRESGWKLILHKFSPKVEFHEIIKELKPDFIEIDILSMSLNNVEFFFAVIPELYESSVIAAGVNTEDFFLILPDDVLWKGKYIPQEASHEEDGNIFGYETCS